MIPITRSHNVVSRISKDGASTCAARGLGASLRANTRLPFDETTAWPGKTERRACVRRRRLPAQFSGGGGSCQDMGSLGCEVVNGRDRMAMDGVSAVLRSSGGSGTGSGGRATVECGSSHGSDGTCVIQYGTRVPSTGNYC
jgi:hypothetical protein